VVLFTALCAQGCGATTPRVDTPMAETSSPEPAPPALELLTPVEVLLARARATPMVACTHDALCWSGRVPMRLGVLGDGGVASEVWADAHDVFVPLFANAIAHFHHDAWTLEELPTSAQVVGIDGDSAANLYALASPAVFRRTDAGWALHGRADTSRSESFELLDAHGDHAIVFSRGWGISEAVGPEGCAAGDAVGFVGDGLLCVTWSDEPAADEISAPSASGTRHLVLSAGGEAAHGVFFAEAVADALVLAVEDGVRHARWRTFDGRSLSQTHDAALPCAPRFSMGDGRGWRIGADRVEIDCDTGPDTMVLSGSSLERVAPQRALRFGRGGAAVAQVGGVALWADGVRETRLPAVPSPHATLSLVGGIPYATDVRFGAEWGDQGRVDAVWFRLDGEAWTLAGEGSIPMEGPGSHARVEMVEPGALVVVYEGDPHGRVTFPFADAAENDESGEGEEDEVAERAARARRHDLEEQFEEAASIGYTASGTPIRLDARSEAILVGDQPLLVPVAPVEGSSFHRVFSLEDGSIVQVRVDREHRLGDVHVWRGAEGWERLPLPRVLNAATAGGRIYAVTSDGLAVVEGGPSRWSLRWLGREASDEWVASSTRTPLAVRAGLDTELVGPPGGSPWRIEPGPRTRAGQTLRIRFLTPEGVAAEADLAGATERPNLFDSPLYDARVDGHPRLSYAMGAFFEATTAHVLTARVRVDVVGGALTVSALEGCAADTPVPLFRLHAEGEGDVRWFASSPTSVVRIEGTTCRAFAEADLPWATPEGTVPLTIDGHAATPLALKDGLPVRTLPPRWVRLHEGLRDADHTGLRQGWWPPTHQVLAGPSAGRFRIPSDDFSFEGGAVDPAMLLTLGCTTTDPPTVRGGHLHMSATEVVELRTLRVHSGNEGYVREQVPTAFVGPSRVLEAAQLCENHSDGIAVLGYPLAGWMIVQARGVVSLVDPANRHTTRLRVPADTAVIGLVPESTTLLFRGRDTSDPSPPFTRVPLPPAARAAVLAARALPVTPETDLTVPD